MQGRIRTLAELKREANAGEMSLCLLEWHGKTGEEIPDRLKGIRKVIRANSVGLIVALCTPCNGQTESTLNIPSAKLVEYDGEYLTLYQIGERKPTAQEQSLLDEWQKLQEEYVKQNPYGETFWKKKDFFQNSKFPYMSGFSKMLRGKRYQMHNGMVLDTSVRGDAVLKYRVIFGNCPLSAEEIAEREEALKAETTKYFNDEMGEEYWYSADDMKKHYTRMEG